MLVQERASGGCERGSGRLDVGKRRSHELEMGRLELELEALVGEHVSHLLRAGGEIERYGIAEEDLLLEPERQRSGRVEGGPKLGRRLRRSARSPQAGSSSKACSELVRVVLLVQLVERLADLLALALNGLTRLDRALREGPRVVGREDPRPGRARRPGRPSSARSSARKSSPIAAPSSTSGSPASSISESI